jgi:hypothetical protein
MNEKMTPEQALKILDDATSRLPLSRPDHVVLQTAVQVLHEALAKPAE